MDVAVVFDGGTSGDFATEEEARELQARDFPTTGGLASDFSVNKVGHLKDLGNHIITALRLVLSDEGDILSAGRSVFWHIDGEGDFFAFAGL